MRGFPFPWPGSKPPGVRAIVSILLTFAITAGCRAERPMRPLAEVLRDHTAELLRLPGVVGTGEGLERGHAALLVLVQSRAAADGAAIPKVIEGYQVRIREVGDVKADPRR